jgi:glycolate oxidase iron-sulfur subunit
MWWTSAPQQPGTGTTSAPASASSRVVLLQGCVQGVVTPRVHAASTRLLALAGAEVVPVPGCCGALVHHMGREAEGQDYARALLGRLRAEIEGEGLDAIVSDASGCGMHVKDFAWQFRGDESWGGVAERVAALTRDISEVLLDFGLPPPAAPAGEVVAYHSACSMQHGQRVDGPPRALLRAAGYDLREVPEGHLCCGSAGTYNLLQPEIAARLRERKLANIRRTGARMVATGNVGCAMQLAGEEDLAVMHTVELLDRALGGSS